MGLARYGMDRKKLAALIPTRTAVGVSSYVDRYHDKLLKEGEQHKAEDEDKMKDDGDDDDDEKDNDNEAYLRTGRWTSEEHGKLFSYIYIICLVMRCLEKRHRVFLRLLHLTPSHPFYKIHYKTKTTG